MLKTFGITAICCVAPMSEMAEYLMNLTRKNCYRRCPDLLWHFCGHGTVGIERDMNNKLCRSLIPVFLLRWLFKLGSIVLMPFLEETQHVAYYTPSVWYNHLSSPNISALTRRLCTGLVVRTGVLMMMASFAWLSRERRHCFHMLLNVSFFL